MPNLPTKVDLSTIRVPTGKVNSKLKATLKRNIEKNPEIKKEGVVDASVKAADPIGGSGTVHENPAEQKKEIVEETESEKLEEEEANEEKMVEEEKKEEEKPVKKPLFTKKKESFQNPFKNPFLKSSGSSGSGLPKKTDADESAKKFSNPFAKLKKTGTEQKSVETKVDSNFKKVEDVKTGEENDEILFETKTMVFQWNATDLEGDEKPNWFKRGVGPLKLSTVMEDNQKINRILVRETTIKKILINVVVNKHLAIKPSEKQKKCVTISYPDKGTNDETQIFSFLIRFSNEELATEFYTKVNNLLERE
eukprot:TRINITY_DN2850_c0_g1_i1.p1 TRINITY_DN2850_c0_g1~~TRINITY_DN2850_c0_g1_i1.p1  ORF type:complete len:308 (-),score=101.42 TRINITY_DN2850_c0_g1_i1:415-1338(-)